MGNVYTKLFVITTKTFVGWKLFHENLTGGVGFTALLLRAQAGLSAASPAEANGFENQSRSENNG